MRSETSTHSIDEVVRSTRVLGRGSFGVVFQGTARFSNEETKAVAIKQINITPAEIGGTVEQNFQKEAQLLSRLHHRNIVQFYASWNFPWSSPEGALEIESPYENAIVMEYMPDGSLSALIAQYPSNNPGMPWNWRIEIALDIAYGLQYLHEEEGQVHRDLKPQNILLKRKQRGGFLAKIADFGLTDTKDTVTRSRTGYGVGTTQYQAPETFTGDSKYTASDVYAYANILWELATHRVPYAGMNTYLIYEQVMRRERLEIREPEDCTPRFAQLIRDCWAHDRHHRPGISSVIDQIQAMSEDDLELVLRIRAGELADREVRLEQQSQEIVGLLEENVGLQAELGRLQSARLVEHETARQRIQRLERMLATEVGPFTVGESLRHQGLEESSDTSGPPLLEDISGASISTSRSHSPVSVVDMGSGLFAPVPVVLTAEAQALQHPLITACEKGETQVVRVLLSQGADLRTANAEGQLPLGAAIWSCNRALLRFLGTQTAWTQADWRAAVAANEATYGALLPEVQPLAACCSTFGDLYRWYRDHGGAGYGLYSDSYYEHAEADNKGLWIQTISKSSGVRVGLFGECVVLHLRNGKTKTRLIETALSSEQYPGIGAQHNGFRDYALAMLRDVNARLSVVPGISLA